MKAQKTKKLLWLGVIGYWLWASNGFSHFQGIDCKNKACRTMTLNAISFESNGKKQGLGMSLEGDKETFAKWKFIIPEGYSLDANTRLGKSIIMVNLCANVLEKGLTSATWPSPYAPFLSFTLYNPKTNTRSQESGGTIDLIDSGSGKNKAITSQGFVVNTLEGDMEIEIILKRPGGEERSPTIILNKDSVFLAYIFLVGEKPALPDRYEKNNTSDKATIVTDLKMPASIWDGISIKPIDVDWYVFTMENYGSFKIGVTASDEKSSLKPSLKLYNDKLKLLNQSKGTRAASIGWTGQGKFFIEVSNSGETEGPVGHRYVISIEK